LFPGKRQRSLWSSFAFLFPSRAALPPWGLSPVFFGGKHAPCAGLLFLKQASLHRAGKAGGSLPPFPQQIWCSGGSQIPAGEVLCHTLTIGGTGMVKQSHFQVLLQQMIVEKLGRDEQALLGQRQQGNLFR